MKRMLHYLESIDRRALAVTILAVSCFLGYLSFNNDNMVVKFKELIGKSHKSSANSEIYCSKKGNENTAFCNDKRDQVNEQWKDIALTSSGGRKSKAAFSLKR